MPEVSLVQAVRRGTSVRYLKDFGVAGASGDTAKINDALVASAAEGFVLVGHPGMVVPLETVGTKNFVGPTGGVVGGKGYAIEIPTGAALDMAGTVLLGASGAADFVAVSNKRTQAVATGTATTDGTKTLTAVTGSGWAVGQYLSGPGIPANALITAVGAGTLTIDQLTTASASGVTISAVRARDVVQLCDVVVDGGGSADASRTVPAVWLYGLADGSRVDGFGIRNASFVAAQVSACEGVIFDRLAVKDIRGQGWCMGGNLADQLRRCDIGTIEGERVADYGGFSQPGNPCTIGGVDVTFQQLRARNCAGGHKVLPNASNIRGVLAYFDGTVRPGETDNGTSNSGFKVQGTDVTDKLGTVDVKQVVARFAYGAGLFGRAVADLSIGSYRGFRNGRGGVDADIDLDSIDSFACPDGFSRRAGFSGLFFGDSMGHVSGRIVEHDPAQVTLTNAVGVTIGAAANGKLSLEIMDGTTGTATTASGSPTLTAVVVQPGAGSGTGFQQGMKITGAGIPANTLIGPVTPTTLRLVDAAGAPVNATASASGVAISTALGIKALAASSATTLEIAPYRTNAANGLDIRSERVVLNDVTLGTGSSARSGTVQLTASATTKDISSQNIKTLATGGGFVEPLVQLTPMNAPAVALGIPRYTVPSNFTLRLTHPAAVGTEVYAYNIVGYRFRTTQFA